MKPSVWKGLITGWWQVDTLDDGREAFKTWREAFDWAYAHATQHRKEER